MATFLRSEFERHLGPLKIRLKKTKFEISVKSAQSSSSRSRESGKVQKA